MRKLLCWMFLSMCVTTPSVHGGNLKNMDSVRCYWKDSRTPWTSVRFD